MIDTGGIEPDSKDIILSQMRAQAQLAIEKADVIIFVVDIKTGVTAADSDVATMLLKSGKPVVLCVNKVDKVGQLPPDIYEFYNLGLGDPFAVSSQHGHGTGDLLDAVVFTNWYGRIACSDRPCDAAGVHCIHYSNADCYEIICKNRRKISSRDGRSHYFRWLYSIYFGHTGNSDIAFDFSTMCSMLWFGYGKFGVYQCSNVSGTAGIVRSCLCVDQLVSSDAKCFDSSLGRQHCRTACCS